MIEITLLKKKKFKLASSFHKYIAKVGQILKQEIEQSLMRPNKAFVSCNTKAIIHTIILNEYI